MSALIALFVSLATPSLLFLALAGRLFISLTCNVFMTLVENADASITNHPAISPNRYRYHCRHHLKESSSASSAQSPRCYPCHPEEPGSGAG